MEFQILGSSSSGNCSILKTENTSILIDAGFSGKKIKELLNTTGNKAEDIDAIFLTHEHSDHSMGIRGLSHVKEYKVFATYGTAEAIKNKLKKPVEWQIFESGSRFRLKDLEIDTFSIPHDAYDPVGYVFSCGDDSDLFSRRKSMAWATDLGYVPSNVKQKIKEVDLLVLEANYDPQELENCEKRPWSLKQRIKSRHGHLSNLAALEFLKETTDNCWKTICLAHLSKDCNKLETVKELFNTEIKKDPYTLHVIDPREAVGPKIYI